MIRLSRSCRQTLVVAVVGATAAAQQPPQFKASLKTKNASDGTTSTGTMYFGGAKVRTELTSDGQNVIMLIDPAAKAQYMLMPTDKIYMQMPIGQGVPIPRPSDPTNPCAAGSGNTDCVRGSNEAVNGHSAIRWDYTNASGVRTRAWISPRLHYAVKTEDDDGNSTELSNIAEGAQAASLFSIPSGYTKMDMGMAGGGGGRGRGVGRANANDPVASAMANLPADLQAQAAAAMRGQGARGPTPQTGSAWEKGNGWIVTVTITATESKGPTTSVLPGVGPRTLRKTYSIRWTGSLPLNFGSPSPGVPGGPGPMWSLLAGQADIGTAAANKVPITLSVTADEAVDESWTSDCKMTGIGEIDPGKSHAASHVVTQVSATVVPTNIELLGQGNLALSSDLKTYDLVFGLTGGKGKEETKTHTETTGCRDKQLHTQDETRNRTADYDFTLNLTGEALPATMSTISGSKKMPVRIDGRELNATVSWTIAPIR